MRFVVCLERIDFVCPAECSDERTVRSLRLEGERSPNLVIERLNGLIVANRRQPGPLRRFSSFLDVEREAEAMSDW